MSISLLHSLAVNTSDVHFCARILEYLGQAHLKEQPMWKEIIEVIRDKKLDQRFYDGVSSLEIKEILAGRASGTIRCEALF